MAIRNSSCLNCAAMLNGIEKDTCDYTGDEITDMNHCCDDWEPNDEELLAVVQEENAELRAKLTAAEQKLAVGKGHLKACELQINKVDKERDEAIANSAALYRGMEIIANATTHKQAVSLAIHYAATVPSNSAERVKALVDLAELIAGDESHGEGAWARDKAQKALKEWRNEK